MQKEMKALPGWIQTLFISMNVSLKKWANKEVAEDSTGTFIYILQKKTKRGLDKSDRWFW
jgi:TRAP-type mannitol/chloroaromatic compound transport system permease small subunit